VAGRTGTGAVLGSKNVKALAFHGAQRRPHADSKGISAVPGKC
jgi:aldehyde:ferredoxin oxidoreductase